ncbi:MAG TPA: cytochrome c [Thermoanaerobaculia bacterium]|nr:cytochrome c [Thermoanaerobaculia bacterium]
MASEQEIQAASLNVFPSGKGLPAGKGTARQGKLVYDARCAECHGPRGEGKDPYPPLAGGVGSLATDHPLPTVNAYWPYATSVWDYVRRAMPYEHPGTLTADQVYSVTGFILSLDRIVAEDEVLDRESLPRVQMPNRDGFIPDPRPPDLPSGAPGRGR